MNPVEQLTDEIGIAPGQGAGQAFSVENDQALAALVNLIAVLADNEYLLGLRISEWSMGAPSLEAGVACAAITQEKLGHSRALYPLLEELPWPHTPAPLQREDDRQRRYSVSYLDQRFASWAHVVAALALLNPGLQTLFRAVAQSSYTPLARRVQRILEEEDLNTWYAQSLVRDLVAAPTGKEKLQAQVDDLFVEMLCWFGPAGEPGVEALRSEGILSLNNEEMRQAYLNVVMPVLQEIQIEVPVQWNAANQRWEYEELPWSRWNNLQRRLDKRPTKTS